MMKWFFLFFIW